MRRLTGSSSAIRICIEGQRRPEKRQRQQYELLIFLRESPYDPGSLCSEARRPRAAGCEGTNFPGNEELARQNEKRAAGAGWDSGVALPKLAPLRTSSRGVVRMAHMSRASRLALPLSAIATLVMPSRPWTTVWGRQNT